MKAGAKPSATKKAVLEGLPIPLNIAFFYTVIPQKGLQEVYLYTFSDN